MSLLGGAALAAALELDATHVGQFLLSRPLVMGAAVGWAAGKPAAGAYFGAVFELLSAWNLPVGGALRWSAPVAAGAAALLAASPGDYEDAITVVPACLFGGLAIGWAHARLEIFERARRSRRLDAIESRVEAGAAPRHGALIGEALLLHGTMTFLVIIFGVEGISRARPLLASLPDILQGALSAAALSLPGIGLASLVVQGIRRS